MDEPLHTTRFPGETDQYRRARDELLEAEIELRRSGETVAAQRGTLPLGGEVPTDYVFEAANDEGGTRELRMSELFADGKDTLYLYSFMFIADADGVPLASACPACTSIIDALDGEAPHIAQLREHARRRGWRHIRLLSSASSTYNHDYNAEAPDGSQRPIASVFVRRDGKIHHFWSSELAFAPSDPGEHPRHVDYMWPAWNVLDTTPGGRGDWNPQLQYS